MNYVKSSQALNPYQRNLFKDCRVHRCNEDPNALIEYSLRIISGLCSDPRDLLDNIVQHATPCACGERDHYQEKAGDSAAAGAAKMTLPTRTNKKGQERRNKVTCREDCQEKGKTLEAAKPRNESVANLGKDEGRHLKATRTATLSTPKTGTTRREEKQATTKRNAENKNHEAKQKRGRNITRSVESEHTKRKHKADRRENNKRRTPQNLHQCTNGPDGKVMRPPRRRSSNKHHGANHLAMSHADDHLMSLALFDRDVPQAACVSGWHATSHLGRQRQKVRIGSTCLCNGGRSCGRLVCLSSLSAMPRRGCVACLVFSSYNINLSSREFARQPITNVLWNVTLHEFQKLHLGDACGTECGAAAFFILIISLFTLVFFRLFVLCDVARPLLRRSVLLR